VSRATAGAEQPHAPRVGRLARLLGPLKVTGVFWYKFHRFGITILPNWAINRSSSSPGCCASAWASCT